MEVFLYLAVYLTFESIKKCREVSSSWKIVIENSGLLSSAVVLVNPGSKVSHWVLDGDPTRDQDTGHVHHGVHDLRRDDYVLVHVVIVRPNEIPLVHTKLDSS